MVQSPTSKLPGLLLLRRGSTTSSFHERHEQFIVSFAIYKRRRNYCLHGRTAAAARRRGAPVAEGLTAAAERRRRPSLLLCRLPAGRADHEDTSFLAYALALWWSVGIHGDDGASIELCAPQAAAESCCAVITVILAPFSSDAVDLEPRPPLLQELQTLQPCRARLGISAQI